MTKSSSARPRRAAAAKSQPTGRDESRVRRDRAPRAAKKTTTRHRRASPPERRSSASSSSGDADKIVSACYIAHCSTCRGEVHLHNISLLGVIVDHRRGEVMCMVCYKRFLRNTFLPDMLAKGQATRHCPGLAPEPGREMFVGAGGARTIRALIYDSEDDRRPGFGRPSQGNISEYSSDSDGESEEEEDESEDRESDGCDTEPVVAASGKSPAPDRSVGCATRPTVELDHEESESQAESHSGRHHIGTVQLHLSFCPSIAISRRTRRKPKRCLETESMHRLSVKRPREHGPEFDPLQVFDEDMVSVSPRLYQSPECK